MNWRQWFGLDTRPAAVAAKGLTIGGDGFIPQDSAAFLGTLPRTMYDYGRDVQQGFDSNVVMAPVQWIMRTFTEAHAVVQSRTKDIWKTVEDHPAEMLIDRPNEHYDGDALWKATVISYVLNGNAYWLKRRNRFGEILELWYVPHWLITPKFPTDGSEYVSHYEYRPSNGTPVNLRKEDVVHFRFGLDPRNTRLGLSPLRALLREVFVDDEAANFSAKILQNMGVPGLMVSPKSDAFRPNDQQLQALKEYMRTAFTGDQRGGAMVMGVPTDVAQFGFDPNKLMLGSLRDISEERVCATIGIPAAVVGFGSGLQSTKVGATMRELVRLAWVQCLIPMQTSLGRTLTAQMLGEYVKQPRRFRMRFDDSEVSAFQEEAAEEAKRIGGLVREGILRVDRAQAALRLEVDPKMEIYYRPSNSIPVDKNGKAIPQATPNGAANGAAAGEDEDGEDEEIPAAVAARRNGRNGNRPDPDEEE